MSEGSTLSNSSPSYVQTVTARDSFGGEDTVSVTVTITDVPEPPEAADDFARLAEDTSIEIRVLDNDIDIDGDNVRSTLTLSVVEGAGAGGGRGEYTRRRGAHRHLHASGQLQRRRQLHLPGHVTPVASPPMWRRSR